MPVSPELPASHRLHAIEVTRGGASLAVLLFHSLTSIPAEALHPFLRHVRSVTEFGWLGVNVFFAVSGWCIAERLAAAHRCQESVLHFLRERALRIYPAYWAALALLLIVRLAAVPFNTTRLADNLPVGAFGWFGDLFLLQPYVGTVPALVVSWSLVYELGFYALGAGALALRARSVPSTVLLILASLLALPAALGWHSPTVCYVLGLWPDFLVGVLAWCAARPGATASARLAALVLAAFAVAALALGGSFGGAGRLVALGSAGALWFASRHDHLAARLTAFRIFAWLGAVSYSLYLAHVTVLSPFLNLSQRAISPDSAAFVGVWLVAVLLSLLAGWLLHRWVEAPVERWRKLRWSRPPAPA